MTPELLRLDQVETTKRADLPTPAGRSGTPEGTVRAHSWSDEQQRQLWLGVGLSSANRVQVRDHFEE